MHDISGATELVQRNLLNIVPVYQRFLENLIIVKMWSKMFFVNNCLFRKKRRNREKRWYESWKGLCLDERISISRKTIFGIVTKLSLIGLVGEYGLSDLTSQQIIFFQIRKRMLIRILLRS